MDTISKRNKINNDNDFIKKVNFDESKDKRLKFSYYASIFFILFSLVGAILAGIALYLILKEEKKIALFLKGQPDSLLTSSTNSRNLFKYYTQENNKTLQKYKGRYEVTVSNPTSIAFTVTDESGHDITGTVENQGANLPTLVNFNSTNNISEIKLNYSTPNTDIVLYRIDIVLQ